MEKTIEFLRDKMKSSQNLYLHYSAMADLSCFEEVTMGECKKEVEHYMNAISVIKAYKNFITNEPTLKKAQ